MNGMKHNEERARSKPIVFVFHWFEQTEYYGYCKHCGCYIHEGHPHVMDDECELICADCAFIQGLWSEEEYIHNRWFCDTRIKRAVVRDGKIYVTDDKFPWEKTKKEQRHAPDYIAWRAAVFERDNYTCAICGQVGGTLNAHHIRSFKKFPELRTQLDNGITLCEKCHRKVHREKDAKWLKDSY